MSIQHRIRLLRRQIEWPALRVTHEGNPEVLRQTTSLSQINAGGQVGVYLGDAVAVEDLVLRGSIVVSEKTDVHGGSGEDPGLIRPCGEDVSGLLDSLQDSAICATADALGCEETHAPGAAGLHHRARLLMPVGDKVSLARNPTIEDAKKGADVLVTKPFTQELATEERRVADDHVGVGPGGLDWIRRVSPVDESIPSLDVVQRPKDRIPQECKAVT